MSIDIIIQVLWTLNRILAVLNQIKKELENMYLDLQYISFLVWYEPSTKDFVV